MGQYYKPIFLKEDKTPKMVVSSYDFGNGAKLMEHSWMKNDFVRFVEQQLVNDPQRIVWAGDYADEEPNGENLFTLSETVAKLTHDVELTGTNKRDANYDKYIAPLRYKYLVNFDKKTFVDKSKTPVDSDGWQIHPLPLLTCEGNNRGGGDYRGENELIGSWSRDKIGAYSKKSDIPKGFVELVFNVKE